MRKVLAFLIFISLFICLFWYSADLFQKNDEKLFLTTKMKSELEAQNEKFNLKEVLIVFNSNNHEVENISQIIGNDCLYFSKTSDMHLLQCHQFFQDKIKEYKKKGFKFAGHPYTNYLLDQESEKIKDKIFPLMYFLAFIILAFISKSLKKSIFLFFPALLSSVISLAILKFSFTTMNMVTSIIPLLMFVINLTLVFHIWQSSYYYQSFFDLIRFKKRPILFMNISTSIGFGSLMVSEIEAIFQFGLLSAFMIILTSGMTILWLGLVYPYVKKKNEKIHKRTIFKKVLSINNIFVLFISSIIMAVFLVPKIEVLTRAESYFPEDTIDGKDLSESLKKSGGVPLVDISISLETDELNELEKIEVIEKNIESILKNQNILSQVYLIKQVNQKYAGIDSLPTNKFSLTALRSQIPVFFKDYKNLEEYKLTILGNPMNASEYFEMIEKVKSILNQSMLRFEFLGLNYYLMNSQNILLNDLKKSFLLSLFLIILISYFLSFDFKVIFCLVIINIVPIFLGLSFMSLLGITINIATVMTFSVSLGLIVDNSFHMLHFLSSKNKTYEKYLRFIAYPAMQSSIVLLICFASFFIYDFIPIQHFGICLFIFILMGVFADLFILPRLYDRKLIFMEEDENLS